MSCPEALVCTYVAIAFGLYVWHVVGDMTIVQFRYPHLVIAFPLCEWSMMGKMAAGNGKARLV